MNPLFKTDFYKVGHIFQYPVGTTKVYSNLTPRSDKLAPNQLQDKGVVFFGLQGYLKELVTDWNDNFFNIPKDQVVQEYKQILDESLGKDSVSVEHVANLHDLGYLPIEIKALEEGTIVQSKIPVLTITNTHPDFFWLVNYLETSMSADLWHPCTTATIAKGYRNIIDNYAEKTGAESWFSDFQGHDFSYRGMSSNQSAMVGGTGHLLSFKGTDTIPAIVYLKQHYFGGNDVGFSCAATEHAVMCSNGYETEIDTYKRLITEIYPRGIVSIVSDTWDYWKVISEYTVELKDIILQRDGKVVLRPDSGNPVDIICGIDIPDFSKHNLDEESLKNWCKNWLVEEVADETPHGEQGDDSITGIFKNHDKYYKVTVEIEWNRYYKQFYYIDGSYVTQFEEVVLTPEQKGSVETLWDIFGGTINSKGYKELDSHIGLIYGDSITLERAETILKKLEQKGFASSNIVFGIGSASYQGGIFNSDKGGLTRDTFGFAIKATYCEVNGVGRNIFKDPRTDNGTKKSAKGLIRVEKENGKFVLYDEQTIEQEKLGELKTVFLNGQLIKETTLEEIRNRLKE